MSTTDTDGPIGSGHPVGRTGHTWPCTRFYLAADERDECTCTPLPAPDTERDERLREAREMVKHLRAHGLPDSDHTAILDDEVTRLDAVVTAVRELHQPAEWGDDGDGTGGVDCSSCVEEPYPCPTVRALDGGAV